MAQSHTNYTKHDYSSLATEKEGNVQMKSLRLLFRHELTNKLLLIILKSYEANAMGEVSGTWPSYIKLLIQNFSDT